VASIISQWGAVLWEISGVNNGTWQTAFPKPPVSNQDIWHHFMCAIGAKLIGGKKYIIALQSEGVQWGEAGIQYFGEDYFNSGYMVDCFTMIYDANLVPIPGNHSMWADLVRWFRSTWGLTSA
jgi:hypothetical protein